MFCIDQPAGPIPPTPPQAPLWLDGTAVGTLIFRRIFYQNIEMGTAMLGLCIHILN